MRGGERGTEVAADGEKGKASELPASNQVESSQRVHFRMGLGSYSVSVLRWFGLGGRARLYLIH